MGSARPLGIPSRLFTSVCLSISSHEIRYNPRAQRRRQGCPASLLSSSNLLSHKPPTLVASWLWHLPLLGMQAIWLPTLAFLYAAISYVIYVARANATRAAWALRAADVARAWPLTLSGMVAFSILFVIVFHDSFQCWARAPFPLASNIGQAWQCSQSNSASIPKLISLAFAL